MKIYALVLSITTGMLGCSNSVTDGIEVTRDDYGGKWPITAERGVLKCEPGKVAVLVVGNESYALNGNAIRAGHKKAEEIALDKSAMFLADFTQRTMQLCLDQN